VSARDLSSQTKIKERSGEQKEFEEKTQEDFRATLEAKEAKHFASKSQREQQESISFEAREALENGGGRRAEISDEERRAKKARLLQEVAEYANPFEEDADEEYAEPEEDEESEDDDEAELLREIEKIKQEKADEEKRKRDEEKKEEAEKHKERALTANPLLAGSGGMMFGGAKKWTDDAVFFNQAKNAPKPKQRFVNDAVRSNFHRKFLSKYMP